MSLKSEHSDIAFKRLLKESNSKKFHKSLDCVKNACDAIEDMKGIINYSRIAKYTENHFGGPKRQSIMNNADLRLYIDLRKQEYENFPKSIKNNHPRNKAHEYPCDDLDLKTKSYIDQLRARNAFLEKSMQHLLQEILKETKKNPIDLNKSITYGPQKDLSMNITRTFKTNNECIQIQTLEKVIKRLQKMSNDPMCPLEIRSRDGKDYIVLENSPFMATVLYSHELDLLNLTCPLSGKK